MLAPTPVLKPSPMDISALFSGTWTLFKKKFGLYLLIMISAFAVTFVVTALFVLIIVGMVGGLAAGATPGAGVIATMAIGYLVVIVVAFLAIYKSQAMTIYAAYEVAQGNTPTFSSTMRGTRGFLPRLLVLFVLGLLITIVIGGLFALLMAGVIGTTAANNDTSGAFAMLGLMMLVMFISVPVVYFFAIKLLYVLPVMAIEQADGISALKRSWKLTNGAFWRTLGYVLLVGIAIGVVSTVISFISQIAMIPWLRSLDSVQYSNDPAAVLGVLMTGLPLMIVPAILSVVFEIVAVPFTLIYVTVMYIDQVRRSELPAGFTGGYTPSYGAGYTPPSNPPQQTYPTPPPNPPQPGTGYPPPPPPQ